MGFWSVMEKYRCALPLMSLFLLLTIRCQFAQADSNVHASASSTEVEKHTSDQILEILEHYKQADPVGIPGVPLPDPMQTPDTSQSLMGNTVGLTSILIHGLKNFRIEHVTTNMSSMQTSVGLDYERLDITGLYDTTIVFFGYSGNFSIQMIGVHIECLIQLDIDGDAKLYARDIDMSMNYDEIKMDFENIPSLFQSGLDSFGSSLVSLQIPTILQQFNSFVKQQANDQISKMPTHFPNSISPFDMIIAEARKMVSQMGYDPYKLEDHSQSMGFGTVTLSNGRITGLASFFRMGNVTFSLDDNILHAAMDIGTQEIEGRSNWEASVIGGVLSRSGSISFGVDSVRVQVNLSQPLDTRKRATLQHFDVQLGNLQSRVHGAGTMDYLLEAAVNIFPNLVRNRIMDALEGPLQQRIQEEMDKVDLEEFIRKQLPDIEEQARKIQQQPAVVEETTPVPDPYNRGHHSDGDEED